MNINDSIGLLKNIGGRRAAALKKLNIETIGQLIGHYPRDYDDRSHITAIRDITPGQNNVIRAHVAATGETVKRGALMITRLIVSDGTGLADMVWYNQPYLKNYFQKNTDYIFIGRTSIRLNRVQMESPDYEAVSPDKELLSSGRIVPVYTTTQGVSQKLFRAFIKEALDALTEGAPDPLPQAIRQQYGLCGKSDAIRNIHFPGSDEDFFAARHRLVFEELFMTQLFLLQMRGYIKKRGKGILFGNTSLQEFLSVLSFTLTDDQLAVLEDMSRDFQSGYSMNRLLQGDVGSGKTAVAMAICYICARNGFQSVLMAPTEVLARQHYDSFNKVFSHMGIKTALLIGSMKKKERDATLTMINDASADITIGTHAIIQDGVSFPSLGLAITDEQHRFGVRQRETLNKLGQQPHVLVMTATPIPRTLALILFGDMDISSITHLPPGRQQIDTFAVDSRYRERIFRFIQKEIDSGRQAYAICPAIEESETNDIKSVETYTAQLQEEWFRDYRVGCLHGKMKPAEKDAVMTAFATGEIDLLVSTTVVEVGVNVPNATVMLVENAERFGLSQLHQLRGRVGRGTHRSYCILISDSKNDVTKKRLDTMVKNSSGFDIARLDLELRGPGDFFGTRQHGLPEMKIANLYKDMDILQPAQHAAMVLYEKDPDFTEPEHRHLVAIGTGSVTVL